MVQLVWSVKRKVYLPNIVAYLSSKQYIPITAQTFDTFLVHTIYKYGTYYCIKQ